MSFMAMPKTDRRHSLLLGMRGAIGRRHSEMSSRTNSTEAFAAAAMALQRQSTSPRLSVVDTPRESEVRSALSDSDSDDISEDDDSNGFKIKPGLFYGCAV